MTDQVKSATPEKTITFTPVGGEPRDVVMTYGLLNELVSKVADIDQVAKFFVDETTRNDVLTAVLSERSPSGKITTKITPENLAIELETVDEILSWAAGHVTGFFIRSLTNLAKRMDQMPVDQIQQGLEAALTATSSGSAP